MIRNFFRAAITFIMASLLYSSCTHEELSVPGPSRDLIVATMETPAATRTAMGDAEDGTNAVGILWTADDQIGVFGSNANSQKCYSKTSESSNKADATFAVTGDEAFSEPQFAYYPYSPENDGKSMTSLVGNLPCEQNMDSGNLYGDYKYGRAVESSEQGHKFVFAHLFSMARIQVDASSTPLAGQKLKTLSVTVNRGGEGVNIAGEFTFNAINGEWKQTVNLHNSITLSWSDGPVLGADPFTCYASLFPTIKPGDEFTIEVTTKDYRAVFTATSKISFSREHIYTFPVTLRKYENIKVYDSAGNEVDYKSMLPTINSFSFDISTNSGKLLDNELKWNSSNKPEFKSVSSPHAANINNSSNEITLMIPYLYDFKLKPSFSTNNTNCKVIVNGVEQKSGVTEVDFSKPVTYTVTNTASGYSRDYIVKITNSGLPVVVIDQNEKAGDFSAVKKGGIFGIGAKTVNEFVNFMIRGKDTDWVDSDKLSVYYPDGTVNVDNADCGVRLRGNTTQDYPKKPLAIKFKAKAGESVLGLPSHRRWVLLANWLDHSMIRNTVAFDIAHAIECAAEDYNLGTGIPWNVHGYNVELVIEGHHVGNYFLCEQIKIDENRLNIQKPWEDSETKTFETCGYLFELDNNYDEDQKFLTSKYSVPFMFKDAVSDDIFNSVKAKIQRIEDNIYNKKYEDAYAELNINSVIDQWLIWELTMNHEFLDPRSVYYFMDGNGKLSAGPVWDFDRATFQNVENAKSQGSSGDRVKPYNEWICLDASWKAGLTSKDDLEDYSPCVWYPQLINDKEIYQRVVRARWEVLYPYLRETIVGAIRYYGETMALSYSANNAMWPTTKKAIQTHKSGFSDWAGDENISEWSDVVKNFENVFIARLDGMNTLISQFPE